MEGSFGLASTAPATDGYGHDALLRTAYARRRDGSPLHGTEPHLNFEAILLAAISAIRPSTSMAALYALLSGHRPRPLLVAFVAAGFTVSVVIGVLIVALFHGVQPRRGGSTVSDIAHLVGGIAALGLAGAVHTGRLVPGRRTPSDGGDSRMARLRRRPSLRMAAAAGVVTHVPGVFYLVALTGIADSEPRFLDAVADVMVYNAVWFSLPMAAIVVAGRRPDELRARLDRATAFARRHQRGLLSATLAVAGAVLVVSGATGLLG